MSQNQPPVCETILKAVAETFEMMIFMQTMPAPPLPGGLKDLPNTAAPAESPAEAPATQDNADTPPVFADVYGVALPVEEPVEGLIYIYFPRALAMEVTKNIYGLMDEAAVTDAMLQDAVAEMANTIGGRLMSLMVAEDETFTLGLPEKSDLSATLPDPSEICWFSAGGKIFPFIVTGGLLSL